MYTKHERGKNSQHHYFTLLYFIKTIVMQCDLLKCLILKTMHFVCYFQYYYCSCVFLKLFLYVNYFTHFRN
jgi:hypothetical protein